MADPPYPWYELASGPTLEQGDFLANCLEPLPPQMTPGAPVEVDVHAKVIVLTQSCDLEDDGVSLVMVCPVFDAGESIAAAGGKEKQKDRRAHLTKGRLIGHVLINRCTLHGHEFDHLVTDFGGAFSIPLSYAQALTGVGNRVRMRAPYREHVAQAFGYFYMRVGLPLKVDPLP